MAFDRVKEYKDITIDYNAASGATLLFYTDMPGGAMALRKTIALPATTTRTTRTYGLDATGILPEGTLHRVKITSTAVVRLYGGHLRVRPIGVYFDGAAGEFWETLDTGLGV